MDLYINSLQSWTIIALKEELRRLNLSSVGDKTTLVKRLQNHLDNQHPSPSTHRFQQTTPNVERHTSRLDLTDRSATPLSSIRNDSHVLSLLEGDMPLLNTGTPPLNAFPTQDHTGVNSLASSSPSISSQTSSSLQHSQSDSGIERRTSMINLSQQIYTANDPSFEQRVTLPDISNTSGPHSNFMTTQNVPSQSDNTVASPPRPDSASDHITSRLEELNSLELQLKILKTQDEIRAMQHRLTIPPEELRRSELSSTNNCEVSQMLSLVKRSVDISGLPPAKPVIFSGNPLEYRQWKSTFDLLIEEKDLSPAQKFSYLQSYLGGKALKCIQGYMMFNTAEAYTEARKLLDERFGDLFQIADAFRDKLDSWPKIAASDGEALREYADFLKQCKLATEQIKELNILNDPRILKTLTNCLPKHLVNRWSRELGLKKIEKRVNADFTDYTEFVIREALLACDTMNSTNTLTSTMKNSYKQTKSELDFSTVNLATEIKSEQSASKSQCCLYCKVTKSHDTTECKKLVQLTFDEQQHFMKSEGLCFGCLQKGHIRAQCPNGVTCQYNGCGGNHPSCTHRYRTYNRRLDAEQASRNSERSHRVASNKIPDSSISLEASTVTHKIQIRNPSKQPIGKTNLTSTIVPVYVSSPEEPEREILTYALLDTMSDTSLILKEVCDSLCISRVPRKLKVSTVTTNQQIQWCDEISNLRVRGLRSNKSATMLIPTLYTQDSIPANKSHIPTPDTAASCPHLEHLKGNFVPLQNCEIGLIIGYNCSAASLPLRVVRDNKDLNLPYAIETALGWSVVGGEDESQNHTVHRITVRDLTSEEIIKCLEEDLSAVHSKPLRSQNDLLFLKKMKDGTSREDGFYCMPLPFKDKPSFPNNRSYAMKRFKGLESRLKANSELNEKYREFMEDMIFKGEAKEIGEPKENGWYIPHHGVFNPHKPGKLRVVFDCSASYAGHSLNNHLLQGPDLNNNLTGLLCRFRKERVAVTCDIKKMFHQFRVSKSDRKYLRFLWFQKGANKVVDYQMNVHLFGAVSSPSCAIYGLHKIASDYSEEFPAASAFVQDNFYVDDGLVSVPTAVEAIQLMKDSKALLEKGNLTLHKFLSNDDKVAEELGCEGPTTKVISGNTTIDRTLGLHWDITCDVFRFSEVPVKMCSRRGVLSTVASVFDPLGFLTPFLLKGKLLLQTLCYDKKGWDDPLDTGQQRQWNSWTSSLPDLNQLFINRCYMHLDLHHPDLVELHVFSDASTTAYGPCCYVRLVDSKTGLVSVSLVMGKSRVAPRKTVTIPRLELQAATLAVKLGDFVKKELKYQDISVYYWTDSEAVLGYISNEGRKFHIFVCNRVERIRDSTNPSDWNYVSSEENPADVASRGSDIKNIPSSWFEGPQFLHDIQFCPKQRYSTAHYILNPTDPEIKKVFVNTTVVEQYPQLITQLERYSSWTKLCNVMSRVLKFLSRDNTNDLSPTGIYVFLKIMKVIQLHYYQDELCALQGKAGLPKSSSLYDLDPFLDGMGIIRVGGRLKNSLSPYELRHPVALPSKCSLTKTFVRQKHLEAAHQGRTTTANIIRRSGVHIVGNGMKLISSVIFCCVKCKRLRGQPIAQKMADLPQSRTEPAAPFTYTGMDVFGPFIVKDGRKENKRYALIFSCMASRAIHLEMLNDMSADCFINSLRCFLAIRGPVSALYSDRGTNFVGARNQFQQCIKEISDPNIRQLFDKQCQFKFNVPTASHMGGSWERMIRTVRSVFNGVLLERSTSRIDSASFRTLLYECMYIVNSRPLTTHQLTSESTMEPLPLTPSNLLTMKETTLLPPPGDFQEPDLYSRKRWRRVQFLTEQFWSRWKVEYLQSQQKRSKWREIKPNLKKDDIVLLAENAIPRSEWQLGRIIKVLESHDDLIRKVKIKTGQGQTLERPTHKLIPLCLTVDQPQLKLESPKGSLAGV